MNNEILNAEITIRVHKTMTSHCLKVANEKGGIGVQYHKLEA